MAVQVMRESLTPFLLRERTLLTEFERSSKSEDVKSLSLSISDTETTIEAENFIHSLVERQAKKTPNAIAVQFEAQSSLTYRQLNEAANAVARQIAWSRGTIVPIAISRSTNLIISLLAVLKAGAAYTLLSTDAPIERNLHIINDTNSSFIIVDNSTRGSFDHSIELSIEQMIARSQTMDKKYLTNLNIYQEPSDIAYVIYTSGTTGSPKGVLLSHSSAYTGLSALPELKASQSFKQLLCHSPNFSAAQRTILGTLSRGGTLCLASKENITLQLNDTIQEMGISSLEITPSMLKLIDPSTAPASLTKITLGGEAVGPALVEAWATRVELVSAYGLSECTQLNMRHRLKIGETSRTIGKPIDSTTCFVLTPGSLDRVALGMAGELCLGGGQLAEGYLNMADKTREVFIPNPFGNGRLYRTGDMAITHEDGTLELVGRIDQQIKIDGQRVEPNESNSIIDIQPGVLQSCVISAFILNRIALVAVIVPENNQEWTSLVRDIRSALRSQLPLYAIPRYWVQQEQMPLNLSGKVDIASLAKAVESMDAEEMITSSNPSSISSGSRSTTPIPDTKNSLDSKISEIIENVLSISTVDFDVSFQELGGSSLDAIVVASSLRKNNIHVSVADILQSSSIRDIAVYQQETSIRDALPPPPFSLLPEGIKRNLDEFEDAYPVTPLQEGILADSMLGNASYVYQRIYRLQGVSPSQVRSAMETVLASNSILRTTFFLWKRSFLQAVKPAAVLPWTELEDTSLEKFLQTRSSEEMTIDGPLIRAAIVDTDVLVLEMHHGLFDFWSSQFIIADTISILQLKKPIPRLPFSSYVSYQQNRHDESAKKFWKDYLDSASPTILEFSKSTQSGENNQSFVLTSNLATSISDFCHSHGVTLGATIHAIWALTIASALDSTDVTFVTAFSGRDADIDGILYLNGPTLCTVPMRVRLDDTISAIDFTKNVQKNLWNLSRFAHSGMRNALTAGSMKPGSFNTMINLLVKLQQLPEDTPLVPILTHGDNFTQYMTIEISETDPTSIKMLVPVSADQTAAQALLDRFATIAKSMAASPGDPAIEMHSGAALTQGLTQQELIAPADLYPKFGLAHSAFESFAVSMPNKVAVRTNTGRSLSYRELNSKANSFASFLISVGVNCGEMIPLYMEKSTETLISILGILKAGASFTPLDPANPYDRNAFIIRDVGAMRIITDRKNKEACSSFGIDMVITEDLELSSANERNPEISELTPESVIYAIYTSGSTGFPKGVLVQHSAVTASTEGMIEATAVTSEWNALWVLNYVFDASYYDVFTIFSAGATLCLAPQDDLLSNLPYYINEMGIEQVMLTPTITKLISEGPSQVPQLKVLNVCGEKIDLNILEWAKSVDVYNGYGPTEATILMTVSHVKPDGSLNSIGFPLKYATAVIIPADGTSLEEVPQGSIGELCVSGPHLAKGYLNRPEQTNASFIEGTDGMPLYRTGDLARWADDGSLECLGRKDYQIKLNGFRIELGEIENAILHTGEVDAVVVSVAEVHGKRQLVAFCIFKDDHRPGNNNPLPPNERLERVSQLMSQLTSISHYMMPALFLPFTSFPTLPSGKANRKALVLLVEQMQKTEITQYIPLDDNEDEFQAASSEEELVMRQVWASVLDEPEESIGANSSFLSLGGDSISAINVVAACRQLSYTISVSNVLANPTLAKQAKHLKIMNKKKVAVNFKYEIPSSVLAAIKMAGINYDESVEEIYPCGPGQIEFLTQGHKKEQFWNLTACRELPQEFDLEKWKEVTLRMTAKNQILRSMYYRSDLNDDSSWHQIVLKDSSLNYECIFYATEEEKIQHIDDFRDSLFVFGKPNIKYRVLQSLSDGSRTLCIKVDHGSYDGTLLRILDDQFKAIARGETNIPPVNSFKTFVDWAYSGDRKKALQYWKESLETYVPKHNLPSQPIANKLKFSAVTVDVDTIATKFGVTASSVFQGAYSLVIGRLSGTNDVLVDNLLTGRNADVENPQLLNGTCANFLPFRSEIAETKTIEEFLKETQAQFWDTTEHGMVGLHNIYKSMSRDRQIHSAKTLYCFQPFEPVPASATVDHMRWIVMAQSKVFMTINYALMVEVQKTINGHRFKLQWDSKVLSDEQIEKVIHLFNTILNEMGNNKDGRLAELGAIETDLHGLWRA